MAPVRDAVRRVRAGDPDALGTAVAYLVERPRFFGSGYLFEQTAAAVAVGPDAGALALDIRAVVVTETRAPLRRETRYVARLAARYWNDALQAQLEAIPGPAARLLLTRAPEIRASYRGSGLLSKRA